LVKKTDSSGDGLSPLQQFEAGKVIQRATEIADLTEIVEVNKIFGFIQTKGQNYLFLEPVNGDNFQQMQKGEVEQIPVAKLVEILQTLKTKLSKMKHEIENDPIFIQAKQVYFENTEQEKHPLGYDETISNLKHFYYSSSDESPMSNISFINQYLDSLDKQIQNQEKDHVYNLIANIIQFLLKEKALVHPNYVVDIVKYPSLGQDNLMYDKTTGKIVIIDPGPPIGENRF